MLYNLGKCSFLRNKLSSNLTKVAIGFEVCQLAQVDRSYIEGNPLCISKYLHYMKKKTFTALFETTKNTKQGEGGRRTFYTIACREDSLTLLSVTWEVHFVFPGTINEEDVRHIDGKELKRMLLHHSCL